MDLGLRQRVVLVTGASRGIGRSVAKRFAAEGSRVAITYNENREAAEGVAGEIASLGAEAIVLQLKLEFPASVRSAVETVIARWKRIDVLVNNACASAPLTHEAPDFDWACLLRANIEGPLHAVNAVVPFMREARWGRIVNVSSALAVDGSPRFGWYSAAKSALHGLTRTHARELGSFGILVNAVMPGLTLTEKQPVHISQRHREQAAFRLPIRRLPEPDEVAMPIVFLSSAANTIITGEIMRVSGGRAEA